MNWNVVVIVGDVDVVVVVVVDGTKIFHQKFFLPFIIGKHRLIFFTNKQK